VYLFQWRDAEMPYVAEIIKAHVTLEARCIDRLYLTACVPHLQSSGGVIDFFVRGVSEEGPLSRNLRRDYERVHPHSERRSAPGPRSHVIPRSNSVKANAST
jgi:hypothetical protein